ncbi:MAG: tetratricopeptide repeat protein [Saccharothrix sp.]|nr:tetratricopeptide repeat protein [Saccharothrix sp.]
MGVEREDGVDRVRQTAVASGSATVYQAGRDIHVHRDAGARPVVWPVRVGRPPRLVDHYQDRDAQRWLAGAVAAGEAAVVVGARPGPGVLVSGLGGVGKSQLAAHHAWSVWPDASTDLALWVTAQSRDGIVTAYTEAARRVLAALAPGIAQRAPEEAAEAFTAWLAATRRRWLIVLDDVQAPRDLHGLWPPRTPSGRVVVTTRRRDAALSPDTTSVIELGVYTEAEAVAYLTRVLPAHTRETADAGQLRGLAADLGHLPLALAQAAAFIANKPLLTVAGYRDRLADRRRTLAEVMPAADELPDPHRDTVAAAWSLSVERADQLTPVGLARPLLELASTLDPNGTPHPVFTSGPVLAHLAAAVGREVDAETARDGLGALHRLSLITLNPADTARTVAVHALIQRVVRDAVPADRLLVVAKAAADAVLDTWPDDDSTAPDLTQALRSAVETLHVHAPRALWRPTRHPVLFRAGRSLGWSGQVRAATGFFEQLHRQARSILGPDHRDTFDTRNDLAYWQASSGDTAEAVAAFRQLIADQTQVLGPDHRDTFRTRRDLARWQATRGDNAEALAAMERLVADQTRALGPDHRDTLRTRSDLAYWRASGGDIPGAVTAFEQLVVDLARVLGPDDRDTFDARRDVAYWRAEGGDVPGAVAAFEQLVADQTRAHGPDHRDTFRTRRDLAHWQSEAADATLAESADRLVAIERLIADQTRVLGPDHRETLRTRGDLARRTGWGGDVEGAVTAFEALLADRTRVMGPDHQDTLDTRNDLAYWRARAGDVPGAITAFETLLADQTRVMGPNHPDTFRTRGDLARCTGWGGDPRGAATAYEALLTDRTRVLGPDHRDTLDTRNNLAYWQAQAGDVPGAVTALERLLADQVRVLGPEHPDTSGTRKDLARRQRELNGPGSA